MYSQKWPDTLERRIRKECARFGEALPADLVKPPVLNFGLALYVNAWYELNDERGTIFDAKGKPHDDYVSRRQCLDYAAFYDLNHVQTDDLWYYVSAMDRAYMTYRKSIVPRPAKDA